MISEERLFIGDLSLPLGMKTKFMENTLKAWLLSFLHLFFPRQCVVCGTPLQEGEEAICLKCNMDLPRTDYHLCADNPVERMFWGKFLWNALPLTSFIIRAVISAGYCIN